MTAQWYTVPRAARTLSLSSQDVLALVQSGALHSRMVDGALMVSESSIEDYLSGQTSKPKPPTYEKRGNRAVLVPSE